MKIVTITPNPAIDLTVKLEKLIPGEVHRAEFSTAHAGGKGINVSSRLAAYGMTSAASGFLGHDNAGFFERHFQENNIADAFLRIPGESRTNIKIVDALGTTDINLKGMTVKADDVENLLAKTESLFAEGGGLAVLSGSLPPGCPPDFYRRLTKKLKASGAAVLLDADGAALKNALSGETLPDCIKPNVKEFSEWAGESLATLAGILKTARKLLERGLRLIVVSMGGEGAVFVNQHEAIHVEGTVVRLASTVGAGDAMMAGIAAAWDQDLESAARLATAFSTAWLEKNGEGLHFHEKVEKSITNVRAAKL
ncbi:MAG: 1-phosphofructokinase [Treponema sp.]|jgi:1-phosphofructokinase|nr:1-phosphofructokinase [Treponema sp.]